MSPGGPSSLGTILVQRIDAMLGTNLSQQNQLASLQRVDAVSQTGPSERADQLANSKQRPLQETVDRQRAQVSAREQHPHLGATRGQAGQSRADPAMSAGTTSVQTRLGPVAQTILALVRSLPQAPPITGRRPLLQTDGAQQRAPNADNKPFTATGTHARSPAGARSAPASPPSQTGTQSDRTRTDPVREAGGSPNAMTKPAVEDGRVVSALRAATMESLSAHRLTSAPPDAATTTRAAIAETGFTASSALASAIAHGLLNLTRQSGMFYESHLYQAMQGRYPLDKVAQEPQGAIARSAGHAPGHAAQSATSPDAQSSAGGASGTHAQASSNSFATQAAGGQSPMVGSTIDPQAQTLVRQQLEVLANQSFAWRGELLAQVPLDWQISHHEAWKGLEGHESPEHWATRLTVTLPALGEVQARLMLVDNQLSLRLVAPQSHGQLRSELATLESRLSGQGLALAALSVHAESAPGTESQDGSEWTPQPDRPDHTA